MSMRGVYLSRRLHLLRHGAGNGVWVRATVQKHFHTLDEMYGKGRVSAGQENGTEVLPHLKGKPIV